MQKARTVSSETSVKGNTSRKRETTCLRWMLCNLTPLCTAGRYASAPIDRRDRQTAETLDRSHLVGQLVQIIIEGVVASWSSKIEEALCSTLGEVNA